MPCCAKRFVPDKLRFGHELMLFFIEEKRSDLLHANKVLVRLLYYAFVKCVYRIKVNHPFLDICTANVFPFIVNNLRIIVITHHHKLLSVQIHTSRTRIVEISGRVAKSGSRDISFAIPEVSLKRNTSGFLYLDYDASYIEHKNIKCLFLNGTIRLFSASSITYFV